MRSLAEQLQQARERAGLNKTELGRKLGWADNTNVLRIERGGDTESSKVVEWAEACGYEVMVVPAGSADAVASRLHDAQERERRIATDLLDLLREAREIQPGILDYFEDDIARFRSQLAARRALNAR